MARYGAQFGPDITFLGVAPLHLGEPATYADADVVILGAPFDGGTSHRPGTRFGPQYIRQTCYLPHDGSRPSLALRVDGLRGDLTVYDAGDVECSPATPSARCATCSRRCTPSRRPARSRWCSAATTRSPGRTPPASPSTSGRAASR